MQNRTFAAVLLPTMLLALGCDATDVQGTSVEIGTLHHFSAQADGTYPEHAADVPRLFQNTEGVQITLEQAFISFESVELLACETAGVWPALMRDISWVPVARAHSGSSATRIGVPHVEHILDQDLLLDEIGVLEPPLGRYCQLRIEIGPADADATHLPDDFDMVGKSLHLQGLYAVGESAWHAFTIDSADSQALVLDLAHPLDLSAENGSASIVIGKNYDTWLNGIDFASSMTAQGELAFSNALGSLHQHGHSDHGDAGVPAEDPDAGAPVDAGQSIDAGGHGDHEH